MNSITTLDALIKVLDDTNPLDYRQIIKRIAIDNSQISKYETWSEKTYTRNCLARTNKYELILLCWSPGSATPIHCHGGKDCWVYQIDGNLEEKRFKCDNDTLVATKTLHLKPKRLTFMNDVIGFHSISNTFPKRAVSLHIYASPIDNCTIYNTAKNCFVDRKLSYDTYKGIATTPM